MELNSKRMQRDARALLAKLSTLRKEAESLAAVDLRLKTKRHIVSGQSMNLQKELSPAPRTPKTRPNRPLSGCGYRSNTSSTKKTRKKWSPGTGVQFGLMETKEKNTTTTVGKAPSHKSQRRAWGSGPGGNIANKRLPDEPKLILPKGLDDISLHVESEVLRRKAEYSRDPTYALSEMSEKENSHDVWWCISGQGFQSLQKDDDADARSCQSESSRKESSSGQVSQNSFLDRLEKKKQSTPTTARDIVTKTSPPRGLERDVIDLEIANAGNDLNRVCAPQFKDYHTKAQKIFLLQEFSRLWLKKGLGQLCDSIQQIEEEIASRSKKLT
jgi:hypothetical protein|eukprot:Stramenopile-MAST_4_protein_1838